MFIEEDLIETKDDSLPLQGKANRFHMTQLPEPQCNDNEIYAFWRTNNSTKVDVYARSTTKAQISIFLYRTPQAIEKLRMSKKRLSMKQKSPVKSQEEEE